MNVIGVLASLLVAALLPSEWVTVGLAGSLSLSYFFGAWLTIRLLRRHQVVIHLSEIVWLYLKLITLALLCAIPARLAIPYLPGGNTVHLLFVLTSCGVGYILLARFFKIEEVSNTFAILRKGRL